MADTRAQLEEDRLMRDTAKRLVKRDVDNLRGDLGEQGIGSRAMARIREGAEGIADDADGFVRENTGSVAGAAALGLVLTLVYIFRDAISDFIGEHWPD